MGGSRGCNLFIHFLKELMTLFWDALFISKEGDIHIELPQVNINQTHARAAAFVLVGALLTHPERRLRRLLTFFIVKAIGK